MLGLKSNPYLGYDFVGDWFLCGVDGDEFTDAPAGFLGVSGFRKAENEEP